MLLAVVTCDCVPNVDAQAMLQRGSIDVDNQPLQIGFSNFHRRVIVVNHHQQVFLAIRGSIVKNKRLLAESPFVDFKAAVFICHHESTRWINNRQSLEPATV